MALGINELGGCLLEVSENGLSNSFLLTCGGIKSVAWHPKTVGRILFDPNKTVPNYVTTPTPAYTCMHHRIQLAVRDMTMSGCKPTLSLVPPYPPPHPHHCRLVKLNAVVQGPILFTRIKNPRKNTFLREVNIQFVNLLVNYQIK